MASLRDGVAAGDQFRDRDARDPVRGRDVSAGSPVLRRDRRISVRGGCAFGPLRFTRPVRALRVERILRVPVLRVGAVWLRGVRATAAPRGIEIAGGTACATKTVAN